MDNSNFTTSATTIYTYDTQGKVVARSIVVNNGYSTSTTNETYGYVMGVLAKYSVQNSGYNAPKTDYKFDSNGFLIQDGPDTSPLKRYTYDTRGNVIKTESYNLGHLYSVYEVEYDNTPAPRSLIPIFNGHTNPFSGFPASPNNPTRETTRLIDYQLGTGSPITSSDLMYIITYNTNGLATGKVWKNPSNPNHYYQYMYVYGDCK